MSNEIRPEAPTLAKRWREDRRGSSMVTTAVTLPILFMLVMLIFYLVMLLVIKWQLDRGTQEAARHIGEMGRFWQISGTQVIDPLNPGATLPVTGSMAIPEDFFELEAHRIVSSRLRDLRFYTPNYLSAYLAVSVTEPALVGADDSPPVFEGEEYGPTEGDFVKVCNDLKRAEGNVVEAGEYLYHKNVRFILRTSFVVPWWVTIPFTNSWRLVTLQDRALGYLQCPRWTGQREKGEYDKSIWLNVEGPELPWRYGLATPGWPTVTPPPEPTATTPPTTTLMIR